MLGSQLDQIFNLIYEFGQIIYGKSGLEDLVGLLRVPTGFASQKT
jgi:hypothetical protein